MDYITPTATQPPLQLRSSKRPYIVAVLLLIAAAVPVVKSFTPLPILTFPDTIAWGWPLFFLGFFIIFLESRKQYSVVHKQQEIISSILIIIFAILFILVIGGFLFFGIKCYDLGCLAVLLVIPQYFIYGLAATALITVLTFWYLGARYQRRILILSSAFLIALGPPTYHFTKNVIQNTQPREGEVANQDAAEIQWTTYANTEFGFELQYPATWIIETNTNHYGKESKLFCPPELTEIREGKRQCKLQDNPFNSKDNPFRVSAIRLDHHTIDQLPTPPDPEIDNGWIDPSGKYYYQFTTEKYGSYGSIYEHMKSSFRFTK